MVFTRLNLTLSLLALTTLASAQKLKKADKETIANLRTHIAYLADDKLEGRRAGTAGEKLAMEYISNQFKTLGLQPKGQEGYDQPFEIQEGKEVKEGTFFSVNNVRLQNMKEFFPLSFSALKTVEASPAIALQEADMPWFVDLKDILQENQQNPHFDVTEYVRTNTRKAYDKGATAIIIYNTSAKDDQMIFDPKDRSAMAPIPVIYVKKDAAKKYFNDPTATLNLKLKVDIGEKSRTAHNIIGYLDNGAPTTVILGAHFDHLGYGEDGNSMLRTGEKLIHNGADDNASGTAALLELARLLKEGKSHHNNYLFMAFSAEELGLFGSKYFTEHPTVNLASVNYMINMDMVGRLNDSTHVLTVGGYGTSPRWADVIDPKAKKLNFVIHIDSSGSGPSDYASFYRKDIPVLFFFTGQHKDYHRPSDDADRINYTGELMVVNYIKTVIDKLDKQNEKLAFLKTREVQSSTTSFKVTMGIMPDYTFAGEGVRADAVSEDRPAFKAGLKAGDVIIQLGSHKVNSMESYMQALNQFSKGDKAKVKYKRGDQVFESEVQF